MFPADGNRRQGQGLGSAPVQAKIYSRVTGMKKEWVHKWFNVIHFLFKYKCAQTQLQSRSNNNLEPPNALAVYHFIMHEYTEEYTTGIRPSTLYIHEYIWIIFFFNFPRGDEVSTMVSSFRKRKTLLDGQTLIEVRRNDIFHSDTISMRQCVHLSVCVTNDAFAFINLSVLG